MIDSKIVKLSGREIMLITQALKKQEEVAFNSGRRIDLNRLIVKLNIKNKQ